MVLFTSTSTEQYLDVLTKKSYTQIEFFENYETNGNVELKAVELHKQLKFTHVVYQAEQDVIRAARIRFALGLTSSGQTVESAFRFRDKCIMKDYLNQHLSEEARKIIECPIFEKVTSPMTIINFVQKHGLPVVIKPTRGMGSMNTHIVLDNSCLMAVLETGLARILDGPIDYQIEKFVEGQMYHIDGYIEKGSIKLMWPSVYVNTCADYMNSKFLASHTLSASNPLVQRLLYAVEKILPVIDATISYSFHVEIFHTPTDKLVFCEAACRTGGAGVSGVMLELFEVNLNKACVQAQCQDKVTSPIPESWLKQSNPKDRNMGWIVVYPKIGVIKSILRECPLPYVLDYEPTAMTEFKSRKHCTDALASFLVTGADEGSIKRNIDNAVNWLNNSVVWASDGSL